MYVFKFHPNRVGISVKTVHTNLLAKIASCINLQLPTVQNSCYNRYLKKKKNTKN